MSARVLYASCDAARHAEGSARLLRLAVGQKTADEALKQLEVPCRRRCERRLVRLRGAFAVAELRTCSCLQSTAFTYQLQGQAHGMHTRAASVLSLTSNTASARDTVNLKQAFAAQAKAHQQTPSVGVAASLCCQLCQQAGGLFEVAELRPSYCGALRSSLPKSTTTTFSTTHTRSMPARVHHTDTPTAGSVHTSQCQTQQQSSKNEGCTPAFKTRTPPEGLALRASWQ